MNRTFIASAALVLASASLAAADTVTANYTYDLAKEVKHSIYGDTDELLTVSFHWTRTDAPGAGVDSSIPVTFDTYCVDLFQHVSGGTDYTFDVLTPAAAGYSPTQELYSERLWASFYPLIDTDTESAAFQMAIWELRYDSSANLSSGDYKGKRPDSVVSLAQSWLDTVKSAGYSGPTQDLAVLSSDCAQDQITAVPTPGAVALLAASGMLGMPRRRTKR